MHFDYALLKQQSLKHKCFIYKMQRLYNRSCETKYASIVRRYVCVSYDKEEPHQIVCIHNSTT